MNRGILLLYVLNFALQGSLPFTFFRRGGRLHLPARTRARS